jgi:hypothetical protein
MILYCIGGDDAAEEARHAIRKNPKMKLRGSGPSSLETLQAKINP